MTYRTYGLICLLFIISSSMNAMINDQTKNIFAAMLNEAQSLANEDSKALYPEDTENMSNQENDENVEQSNTKKRKRSQESTNITIFKWHLNQPDMMKTIELDINEPHSKKYKVNSFENSTDKASNKAKYKKTEITFNKLKKKHELKCPLNGCYHVSATHSLVKLPDLIISHLHLIHRKERFAIQEIINSHTNLSELDKKKNKPRFHFKELPADAYEIQQDLITKLNIKKMYFSKEYARYFICCPYCGSLSSFSNELYSDRQAMSIVSSIYERHLHAKHPEIRD